MKKLFYGLFCALGLAVALAACGKSDGGGSVAAPVPVPTAGYGGTCPAGYLYSQQYGCLAQAGCQQGQGMYNGQCVPVGIGQGNSCGNGVYTYYGCVPQGQCQSGFGYYNQNCYQQMPYNYQFQGNPYMQTGYPWGSYPPGYGGYGGYGVNPYYYQARYGYPQYYGGGYGGGAGLYFYLRF